MELTVTAVIVGVLLAVLFGGANAYLGLRVGMTISASIPAAVISMAVIRVLMRRDSILENNMVQTIGSAGESLAAGCIFTLPVLFMWAKEWGTEPPPILEITVIAFIGGILGILFMVPLRQALIVKEHGVLPYPVLPVRIFCWQARDIPPRQARFLPGWALRQYRNLLQTA